MLFIIKLDKREHLSWLVGVLKPVSDSDQQVEQLSEEAF